MLNAIDKAYNSFDPSKLVLTEAGTPLSSNGTIEETCHQLLYHGVKIWSQRDNGAEDEPNSSGFKQTARLSENKKYLTIKSIDNSKNEDDDEREKCVTISIIDLIAENEELNREDENPNLKVQEVEGWRQEPL